MIKFSKKSSDILDIKRGFIDGNDAARDKLVFWNKLYAAQPARTICKTCDAPLGAADFVSFGVPYALCDHCGHLNGMHEDTAEYIKTLYSDGRGEDYARNYIEDACDYDDRVRKIYEPKVAFLIEALASEVRSNLYVSDFGCGAGHFIRAARNQGVSARGFEISRAMADFGNRIIGEGAIEIVDEVGIYDAVRNNHTNISSAIGVIEHLRFPHKFLEGFVGSGSRYLYVSLPLFSLSVFLENCFGDVMPRQLAGGHTHLYSRESINWLCRRYGLREVAAWWFGTDTVDLFRSLAVQCGKNKMSDKIANLFADRFLPLIDGIQEKMDRAMWCSEVHMVLAKE